MVPSNFIERLEGEHLLDFYKSVFLGIGDGDNDLPMLRAAGTGVLMGNAKPEVRRLAEDAHIEMGPPLEKEGFSATISRYVENF